MDKELEEQANKLLRDSVGRNERSTARDVEKFAYEAGHIGLDGLSHYDPTNDWDTLDSAFAIYMEPSDLEYLELDSSICDGGDGNVRARNPDLQERRALMRHVRDSDDWGSTAEDIPPLGINDGPRKVCARCKQAKGLMLFSPRTGRRSGLQSWCKECRKEVESQRRNNSRSGH